MPNKIGEMSLMFTDLRDFFSTPERPLTIEEVNVLSVGELKELLIAVRAQK